MSNNSSEIIVKSIMVLMPKAEQRGGAELSLLHFLKYANVEPYKLIVVFFEDGPMVAEAQCYSSNIHVIKMGRLRQLKRNLVGIVELALLAKKNNTKLIFSWMAMGQFRGAVAGLLAGSGTGWFQHANSRRERRMDWLCPKLPTRGIIACSQYVAGSQAKIWPLRPMKVIHPGADLHKFDRNVLPSREKARSQLGLPQDKILIGAFGRLQRWKGFHNLVLALPGLLEAESKILVVLVGGKNKREPGYGAELAALAKAKGVERYISLPGHQKNVPIWMQAMDVIVHTSSEEPFGMVIVEAMALAKPVVASTPGGPEEIINDGIDGLVVKATDSVALVTAILKYVQDPIFASKTGENASNHARSFSAERFARDVSISLSELAAGSPREGWSVSVN